MKVITMRKDITIDSSTIMRKNNKTNQYQCRSRRSGVFITNFDHISHLFLVFLLLILNK